MRKLFYLANMENAKSFFDSFKEFIWDIIGYLLPGSLFLIILATVVKEQYFFSCALITKENGMLVTIFIILSYLIGYVIYSIGLIKEKCFGKRSYTRKIEQEISNRENYKIARKFITDQLDEKNNPYNVAVATVRDIRNIAMGSTPESDQKIYTFMFRSEISNHIANTSLLLGLTGWIFCIFQFLNFELTRPIILFKTELKFMILYTLLIFAHFILREARNRFYAIAIGLPFSILISKKLTV